MHSCLRLRPSFVFAASPHKAALRMRLAPSLRLAGRRRACCEQYGHYRRVLQ